MKRYLLNKLILIIFLMPIKVWAQPGVSIGQDITGMWKGTLYNDTTQKFLTYEIAISEENGKLTGYSYIIFDIDGKKEIGVKKIKIKRKHNQLVIEDVVLISNNYSAPPPRGVRLKSEVSLSVGDTTMSLSGRWSTNPTSEYRPITGSIKLERAADFKPVALYKKLEELHLEKDLSFVKTPGILPADIAVAKPPIQEKFVAAPVVAAAASEPIELPIVVPDKIATAVVSTMPLQKANKMPGSDIRRSTVSYKIKDIVITRPVIKAEAVAILTPPQKSPDIAIKEPVKKETENANPGAKNPVTNESVKAAAIPVAKAPVNTKVDEKPKVLPQVEKQKAPPVVIAKEAQGAQKPPATEVVKSPPLKEKPPPVVVTKAPDKTVIEKTAEIVSVPVKTAAVKFDSPQKKESPVVAAKVIGAPAAEKVSERKMTAVQSVFYQSDSLILTLYDNGDVDGDTVSVLMNGSIIFSKQGLTTKANSKTIYTGIGTTDSIMLVMYAENLGSIPPNTGLLMVQDGEAVYYVRFSADLKTNAAILLSRKKNE